MVAMDCVGMVAELKVEDSTNIPIWECFRNMSAMAASIAMKFLTNGVLINTVTVYGIVVRVNNLHCACLLKVIKGKKVTQDCCNLCYCCNHYYCCNCCILCYYCNHCDHC